MSRYQKKHSSTHTPPAHQPSLSSSSIYHKPQHHPCSIHVLGNLSAQPLTMSSLAYLWVCSPLLHTPYTSSPNHYPPFATHASTTNWNANCNATHRLMRHVTVERYEWLRCWQMSVTSWCAAVNSVLYLVSSSSMMSSAHRESSNTASFCLVTCQCHSAVPITTSHLAEFMTHSVNTISSTVLQNNSTTGK